MTVGLFVFHHHVSNAQDVTSKDANPYVETYRTLLTDVGKLLTENKIGWHINFGTLIGAFR